MVERQINYVLAGGRAVGVGGGCEGVSQWSTKMLLSSLDSA